MRIPFSSYSEEQLPIAAYFNYIPNDSFIEALANLIEGVGAGYNAWVSEFPEENEPDEEPFKGIRFADNVLKEEYIADHPTVYRFLKLAADAYINKYPADRDRVLALVSEFATKYNVK